MVWQSLVRSWLTQQARQAASEAVRAAQQERGAEPSDTRPRPCDIGFVFALGIESGGLQDLLEGVVTTRGAGLTFRQGVLRNRSVVLVETGVGQAGAARGTQALLAGHRPAWVISAGFAGALDRRLRRGDIVLADAVIGPDGRRLAIDLKIPPDTSAGNKGLHVGACLTRDAIVRLTAEKESLGRQHGALAVDMESWTVAEVCRQAKTRFLAIRVISDAVDDELPADVETLARQKSTASRLGAAAAALVRRPSSAKDMLKLKGDALVASDRLARFLAGVVEQLAPPRKEEGADGEGATPANS